MTKRFVLAATLAAAFVTLLAATTLGHAALQSSDPAAGATITTPYTLTATYDEELTPDGSSIVVQSAGGTQVASGTVSADDSKVMTVDLPVLPEGQYTALWTAITADDNGLTRGTFTFNVGTASSSPAATPAPSAGNDSSSSAGALVAVGVAVVISISVLAFVLYRNRR